MPTNSYASVAGYTPELDEEHAGVTASINDRPLLDKNDINDFITNSDAEDMESEDELSNSGGEEEEEEK
ncbi:hypothetical protein M422DRAFT_267978 [Sphaerobolus stellatus SS14]|uniref:Uncharacterized protein n=1 Tax=Sphaerobolus stellatus (strain SS14) TaxID=990650 RepID=A0A0C9UZI9_SPHS4|nr:hypothetical protein M422DRAFT_267978 [Sphaerobolus stellatus SS14]